MKRINLNREWCFAKGYYEPPHPFREEQESRIVDLPHDFMIEGDVSPDAASRGDMGFYNGGTANYTKMVMIEKDWVLEQIYLAFDGIMQHATIEVNGEFVKLHHYGYTPFIADLTPYVTFGRENRITINIANQTQPNSRWYTGAGIYRGVHLLHGPKLHIASDGIFVYTKYIDYENEKAQTAHIACEVTLENHTGRKQMTEISAILLDDEGHEVGRRNTLVCASPNAKTKALLPMTVQSPKLWSDDTPNLYRLQLSTKLQDREAAIASETAYVTDKSDGDSESTFLDSQEISFGIRTVTVDSTYGLRINGKSIKLKGGCVHHDNGILGAASFYDSEYRKLKLLKEIGYNAVRCAHNPPSAEFLTACDNLGLYVFDEAFDAWRMSKKAGDYSQNFEDCWKEDVAAMIERDRNHPSIIFWSTGNEIVERGGLGDGFRIARELAEYVKSYDTTRPVSNALCSFWSGLRDDEASLKDKEALFDTRSEAFTNALDVVGYNYMEDRYESDGRLFPERVILGTESFPMHIADIWDMVERMPHVIGDFTWTSCDYIGEAGIGRSEYKENDDPILQKGAMALTSHNISFPWRLANCGDFDINGNLLPQGAYRSVVWGMNQTHVYTKPPASYGKTELISAWGWPQMSESWNYESFVGHPISVVVYSRAPIVRLYLGDRLLGEKPCGKAEHFTAEFDVAYEAGELRAVSLDLNGTELSSKSLKTTKKAAAIRLLEEESACAKSTDKSLVFVSVELIDEDGLLVPDASVLLQASVSGSGSLAAFGSGNPVTKENYTTGSFTSYHGRCLAVIRDSGEARDTTLTVSGDGVRTASIEI